MEQVPAQAKELRLSFSVTGHNEVVAQVEGSPLRLRCDWQGRGYDLVCACDYPHQLFWVEYPNLTGKVGVQCISPMLPAPRIGRAHAPMYRGLRAEGFESAPSSLFPHAYATGTRAGPGPFPREAVAWAADTLWNPLEQELALTGLEERVAASAEAVTRALEARGEEEFFFRVPLRVRIARQRRERKFQQALEAATVVVRLASNPR